MKSDWWGFFGHKKASLGEKKKNNKPKQEQNHQHKNPKTNQKNPKLPQNQNEPTPKPSWTSSPLANSAFFPPAHLQHPFTGTDQLSFSGLIVAALITPLAPPHPAVGHSCPPPPLCTVGHRMFLRSFVRLQGLRSWHAAASDEWKVSAVLLLQTKKWWTTCYGSTSPRHPSSEAGVTDPSHGTAGRMLGSANEGNRYRNANNYQCLQQLPKSSSAARAGWGGGTRCTPSSWFLQ